jgi:hypothetical protein
MSDFRSLKVWERSHHLALAIYGLTTSFPKYGKVWINEPIKAM